VMPVKTTRVTSQEEVTDLEKEKLLDHDTLINSVSPFVNLVYCCTGDYMEGMAASIVSIVRNCKTPGRLRIRILTTQEETLPLNEWLLTQLNNKLKALNVRFVSGCPSHNLFVPSRGEQPIYVEIRPFDNSITQGKYRVRETEGHEGYWERLRSPLNYARFYLDRYWPDLGKFVYIDADTIVQKDIIGLWETALGSKSTNSKPFFAVFSNCGASYSDYFNMSHPYVSSRFDSDTCAFEAGIYVTDLNQWVAENVTHQIEQLAELNLKESLHICGSQPPLMAVFYHEYQDLHAITDWVHIVSLGFPYPAGGRPPELETGKMDKFGVIEWNGNLKPWRFEGLWKMYWKPHAPQQSWESFIKQYKRRQKKQLPTEEVIL